MSALNDIRKLLKMEIKLAKTKLKDGTVIEAEAFEAGAAVFIVNEEERVPLPVGEYTLVDDQMLIVREEGVIAEMTTWEEKPKEEEINNQEMEQDNVKKVEETVSKTVFFSDEQIVELSAKLGLDDLKTGISDIMTLLSKGTVDKEEVLSKQELAKQEPLVHNPEKKKEKKHFRFAQKRPQNLQDRVHARIANIN